jgi:hypothetical protein
MKRINFMLVSTVLLSALMLMGAPAAQAAPQPQAGLIPVDADPYFKSLTGEAAAAQIRAATQALTPQQKAAMAAARGSGAALGVGDVRLMYADGYRYFTLKAIGGNAEIWVANDLSFPAGDPRPPHVVTQEQIDYLFSELNNKIYPSNTTYFGYTKGRDGLGGLFAAWGWDWYATDNPQRIMVLVFNIHDENYDDPTYPFYVAGYFWGDMNDVYADRNVIHIDSNDWANRVGPGVARPHLVEQVFTHEYEHAIHFDHDPGETSWVDEGLADLAPYLAGYGHSSSHLAYYLMYHRTPLTVWGGGLESYGASYLFQLYLLQNFGGPAFVKALVDEPANGIEGIEKQLAALGYTASFDDIYRDWTLANYLDDTTLTGRSGGQLGYEELVIGSADTQGYTIPWSIENIYGSDNHGNLPIPRYYGGYKSGTVQWPIGDLMPYGPMYLSYKGIQPKLASAFRGNNTTGIAAHSGTYQLWGGKGDLIETTATTALPVTLGSNAKLSFWTFYEIEQYWDFGFVQVSTDGGMHWKSLSNAHTTSQADPSAITTVVANLPGFTGHSNGWVQESFDLSAYAGQEVLLRFLYITDWATVEGGFYVDDLLLADDGGVRLADNLESGSGNWVLGGWQHTTGLAQNDWELTFLNPVYSRGKLSALQIQDDNKYFDESGAVSYQRDLTILNTQDLTKDVVTIVVSNHLPEATSYSSTYRLLVEKEPAKP